MSLVRISRVSGETLDGERVAKVLVWVGEDLRALREQEQEAEDRWEDLDDPEPGPEEVRPSLVLTEDEADALVVALLRGPSGPPGPTGATGATGPEGPRGSA